MRTDNLDPEGNVVTHAWFEDRWSRLTLRTHAVVETLLTDPFRFLITEPERPLPYAYSPDFCERLALYRRPPDAAHPAVRELALAAATDSEHDPARFPLALARRIRERFTLETRPEGSPLAPEATIAAGRGACRDLAVLFVACCRAMGLAARFASGYAHTDTPDTTELHAWGEVFLRGGGWRGYDPSQGLAVTDHHVTVAAAANPRGRRPGQRHVPGGRRDREFRGRDRAGCERVLTDRIVAPCRRSDICVVSPVAAGNSHRRAS